MIRKWPGQTKEEWLAEYHRNKNLTPEEREKEMEDFLAEVNKQNEEMTQINAPPAPKTTESFFANCDHPNSLDNSEATIVWVVVMVIGSVFKGNWIIWIIATIIWHKYITRHKKKKKKQRG